MDTAPRHAAILFADVAGSTRLYETAGDAVALALIGRCIDTMRAVCEERDGRVVKTIGDEVMAVFPSAGNAGYATIDMHGRIAQLAEDGGVRLAIHAGFHCGPVLEDDADFCGFMSVWFFEEQKHSLVLMEYLRRFRPDLVPT